VNAEGLVNRCACCSQHELVERLQGERDRLADGLREIANYRGQPFVGKEPPDREMRKIAKEALDRLQRNTDERQT
jgi:hypothetical protein